jgi:hypothetical protein
MIQKSCKRIERRRKIHLNFVSSCSLDEEFPSVKEAESLSLSLFSSISLPLASFFLPVSQSWRLDE